MSKDMWGAVSLCAAQDRVDRAPALVLQEPILYLPAFASVCCELLYALLMPVTVMAETTMSAITVTEPARLWVGQAGKTHQLRPELPAFDQHVAGRARAMAIDGSTRQVWLHTEDGMFLYDGEGSYQMGWELSPEGVGRSTLVALSDTSLWVAEESALKAFGMGGQALHVMRFPGKVQAMALDEVRDMLWVLTTAKVVGIHPITGEERIRFNPHAQGRLQSLVVDQFTGDLWIGHGGGLLHLHADGSVVEEERADVGPDEVQQLAAVVADDRLIGFWVTNGSEVALYDPEYRQMYRVDPFGTGPQDRIEAMALDPVTGAVWVSNGRYLEEVSPGGQNAVRYDLGEAAQVESLVVQRLTRLAIPPTAEILSPVDGEVLTGRQPGIGLRFTATDFPVDLESATVLAGGFQIEAHCERTDGISRLYGTIEAICVPTDPLPAGDVMLSVTVADREDLRSNTAMVQVRIEDSGTANAGPVTHGLPQEKPTYTPIVSPRGFRPHTPFLAEGDYDYVDTASGNLMISIPLGQEYQVGPLLSYQVKVVHNSNVWEYYRATKCNDPNDPECTDSTEFTATLTNPNTNAGLGWEVHLGRLYAPTAANGMSSEQAARWPNRDRGTFEDTRWMFVTPSGSVHYLYPLPGRTNSTNGFPVRYSKDGSMIRMQQTSTTRIEIEFPSGLVSVFNRFGGAAGTNYCGNGITGCWRFSQSYDPYGNTMSAAYAISGSQEAWTVSDSTGRSHKLIFDRSNAKRGGGDCPAGALCTPSGDEWGDLTRVLTQVRLAAFAGTVAVYNFTTELQTLSRGCTLENEFLPLDESTIRAPILTAIRPPHGQPFTFTTDTTLQTGCNPTAGTVEQMDLPTRGAIAYGYSHIDWPVPTRCSYASENAAAQFTSPALGVATRTRLNTDGDPMAVWSYASQLEPPLSQAQLAGADCARATHRVTTVNTPVNADGNRVKQIFYNAVYQGPQNPSSATSITGWQVTDNGLPYTKDDADSTNASQALFLSGETYLCGGTCWRQRSTRLRYAMEYLACDKAAGDGAGCFKVNPMVQRKKITYHNDGNRWVQTANALYDGAGHFKEETTSDNFDGSAGTIRKVTTDWDVTGQSITVGATSGYTNPGTPSAYLPGVGQSWILNTYSKQATYEPFSGRTYTSLYQFDEGGSLQCVRRLKEHTASADPSDNDIATQLVRGTTPGINAGLPIREVMVGGETAGTGDLAASGACPGSGGSASAGTRYTLFHEYEHGQLARTYLPDYPNWYHADIDQNTGLPSATYNAQDQKTIHTFDVLSRLSTSVPESSLNGANLIITYNNPANADASVIEKLQKSGVIYTHETRYYDRFGRLVVEGRRLAKDGGGFSESRRSHVYEESGLKRRESTWQDANNFDRNKATYFRGYDAFGRAQNIERPDGQIEILAYQGERIVMSTVNIRASLGGISSVTTTTEKDSLGRVIQIATPLHTTEARFDPYDQQYRASRKEGEVTQIRKYGRDARGYLSSETHPEIGPGGNGSITYIRDVLGQVRRMQHGNRDLSHLYDNGARLTKIKETGLGGKPWKEWSWGANNSGTNYKKGRITQAIRHNYPHGNAVNWAVTEDYEYHGALGQMSQKTTSLAISGTEIFADGFESGDTSAWASAGSGERLDVELAQKTITPSFTQSATYDVFGNRLTLSYPSCSGAECTGSDDLAAPAHTVTTNYNYARAVGVSSSRGPSGGYTYHPNFQLAGILYGNGVEGTFLEGENGMHRPTRLKYEKMGTVLFDTEGYSYDAAGNIYQVGGNLYTYDGTSRLTYADVVLPTGSQWETYTYDAFDNITQAQKEDQPTSVPFPVDKTTNRYTGDEAPMLYDSTGNLIQVITNATWTMNWDAFDMQVHFSDGVDSYRYIYGPGDYRIVSLEAGKATVDLRDTNGTLLRQYTLAGTGSPEYWNSWKHEKDFIYGPDGLLASITPTGTTHYSHKDHLGSQRAISDDGGILRGRHDYYPFGQEVPRTGQVDEPAVKFTGHMRDAHGFSDYMLGRTCLWPLRRFASVDPGRDGWNLYAYVSNNPVKFTDPDGQRLQIVHDFSDTSLSLEQQFEIAEEIAQRFRKAGVQDVRTFHSTSTNKLPKDRKPWERTITLKYRKGLIDGEPTVHGRRKQYPGNKGEIAMGAAPTSSTRAMVNFAVNVGAHEGGHATRALTMYDYDNMPIGPVFPKNGERGTVMEQGPSAEERGKEIREFSDEDAALLRKYLNTPDGDL